MKKFLCVILAVAAVISLAACSEKPTSDNTETKADSKVETTTETSTKLEWPDNALFKDIPSVGDNITFYNPDKNEKGYTYSFAADEMDYDDFRKYIAELEKAGFSVYKSSVLSTIKTEDLLPEKLEKGTYNATWIGNRRGVYVAAQWYGDKYYEENNLPKDSNVRLVFYTYNAFAN
ncbi:MAG: hypothetical protein IIW48_11120 [Clostridia bacterium]|nr:hypothetical protein [Clostridia bacterium]